MGAEGYNFEFTTSKLNLEEVKMSYGKKFLITWISLMVVMGIEYIFLPDNWLVKGLALGLTSMIIITIIEKKYPSKKNANS